MSDPLSRAYLDELPTRTEYYHELEKIVLVEDVSTCLQLIITLLSLRRISWTRQIQQRQFKMQFSRHGIPEIVISDNASQSASTEFARFASGWHFRHITSCPLHSKSNGEVESAVKIGKGIS
ncbi:uncharacterized protein [Montipora foliosa]|uniref:uncharacterized protein n=1 Tax=Montipora foliosa TaxID=591990 RepID=UPI0035F1FC20